MRTSRYASMAGAILAAALIGAPAEVREQFGVAQPGEGKRRRTGKTYPHSSDRQKARYARQIAAGQIKFITHGPRP